MSDYTARTLAHVLLSLAGDKTFDPIAREKVLKNPKHPARTLIERVAVQRQRGPGETAEMRNDAIAHAVSWYDYHALVPDAQTGRLDPDTVINVVRHQLYTAYDEITLGLRSMKEDLD